MCPSVRVQLAKMAAEFKPFWEYFDNFWLTDRYRQDQSKYICQMPLFFDQGNADAKTCGNMENTFARSLTILYILIKVYLHINIDKI